MSTQLIKDGILYDVNDQGDGTFQLSPAAQNVNLDTTAIREELKRIRLEVKRLLGFQEKLSEKQAETTTALKGLEERRDNLATFLENAGVDTEPDTDET